MDFLTHPKQDIELNTHILYLLIQKLLIVPDMANNKISF